MTQEMQLELIRVLEDSAANGCGVVILAGAGDAFCSGLDLSELQTLRDKSPAVLTRRGLRGCFWRSTNCPSPPSLR